MVDWMTWFVLAGILVILEIFTGTFYLLMIGIGLGAAGVAALAGAGSSIQYLTAALAGIIATIGLRCSKFGKIRKIDAMRDPNVNLDIGGKIPIKEWATEGTSHIARAMYRGAMWDVETVSGETPAPGVFTIVEIRGSRLIVTRHSSGKN